MERAMPADQDSLETTLAKISRLCLHGHAVPTVLLLLWEAQLANDPVLTLLVPDTYLDSALCEPGRAADVLGIDDSTEPAIHHAYERLFQEIAFLGYGGADNVLLFGYWFHGVATTPETAPIIAIDSEGQVGADPTIQDYLAAGANEHDAANGPKIRQWFAERGIATLASPEAVRQARLALPDPGERLRHYFADEAEKSAAPDRPRE
jgi:hypothetical protein